MPSFPPPGGVTVCEINRDLVVADALSDDRAKDAYGDVLGMVFSPIPFQPDATHEPPAVTEAAEPAEVVPRTSLASTIAESFKQMLFPSCDPNLLQEIDTQKVSWNPHKHCLAFVSGKNQVTVHDFEEPDNKESYILTSDHQKDVKAVEWRPNSGKVIAVGCKGGICLWSASYPGNVASVKSGVTSSSFGAFPRGSSGQWILVDILRGSSAELVSALCWKPDGRYLVSASCNSPSFTIWDVSQGLGTPIKRGLSSISLVRWSPSGDYLLTAKLDGTFHLWETNTWTSEPWSSSNGYVSGANWDPEGRTALLSFSNSTTLGSIHFSSKPPSLDAHLLPVELPEISSLIVSRGIDKLAWDSSGERLALSFKDGNEMYHGLVAVYDVRRSPLVSVSLVGFIRGPGDGAKPLAFAFHSKFKQGPLLSVCWSSGWCCTYPLILRPH
ncbi:aladin-like [Oryza glaberrima]|uniref:Aladin seven-bladed propeller domain-containing protein n=1 Tax=Oryza glaberrima TaxID=4538 RepID=I1R3M6_ORYGL|nr:aladin-like [Oryza glaberrima]